MTVGLTKIGGAVATSCEPRTERYFRAPDHRAEAAQEFVFLGEPVGPAIPPRRRRERSGEADTTQPRDLAPRDARRPGKKARVRRRLPHFGDDVAPDSGRNGVRILAAEASDANAGEASQPLAPPVRQLLGGDRVVE